MLKTSAASRLLGVLALATILVGSTVGYLVLQPTGEPIGSGEGWLTGWAKRVKLAIDQTDMDADLTNFPVLLYLSSSSGRLADNIIFIFNEISVNSKKIAVTTSDGVTQCYVEIEKWSYNSVTPANSKAWLWVKAPSVSGTVDTDLYLYYDNTHADNTAYVGDPESTPAMNVWDANFKMVQHLRDKTTSTTADSSTNNKDGTKKGANEPIVTTAGKIDDAQNFDGVNDYIDCGDVDILTAAITLELWLKADTWRSAGAANQLLSKRASGIETWDLLAGGTTCILQGDIKTGSGDVWVAFNTVLSTGTWYHLVIVYNGLKILGYVNGVKETTEGTQTGTIIDTSATARIGSDDYNDRATDGIIDEVRISNNARSIAWIKATYETGRDHLLDWGSEEIFNSPPTNDLLVLDLFWATYKGDKTLLCAEEDYDFYYQCSDANGVTDISYAQIQLDPTGKNVVLRATRGTGDAWTFSESDPNDYVTLNVGASQHSTSGNQKTLEFKVTINWGWGDSAETVGVRAYVVDSQSAPDQDDYPNIFGVECHLASSSLLVSDYRVNPSQTLTFSGYWKYDGTTVAPPDGNYAVVIKLSGVQKGSPDTTLVSGYFSINDVTAESTVGSCAYTVEASHMASAGSYEYYNTGDDASDDVYGSGWAAQTFTVNAAHTVTSVKLKLYRIGSPGTVTVSIRATSGLHPTGVDLTAGTINGNTLTTDAAGAWYTITLTEYTLSASTKYAIVVRALSGNDSNISYWRYDGSSPTYAGGNVEWSNLWGEDWKSYTTQDYLFEVWGNPYTFSAVIVDKIKIVVGGINNVIDTRTGGTAWYTAVYEYNNTPFTGSVGTLYLNGTIMMWAADRWTYAFSYEMNGSQTIFSITGVLDTQYGLTVINNVAGNIVLNWATMEITISKP